MEVRISIIFIYFVFRITITSSLKVSIATCPCGRKSITKINTFSVSESYMLTATGDRGGNESLQFVLNSNFPFNCENDSILTTMKIDNDSVVFTQFGHFGRFGTIDGSKVIHWLYPDKFCGFWESASMEAKGFHIGFCQSLPHKKPTVLFKCCAPGYIMDFRTQRELTCQPLRKRRWTPTFYDPESFQQGTCAQESNGSIEFEFVTEIKNSDQVGIQLVKYPYSLIHLNITESGIWWYLLKDGRLRSRKRYIGRTSGSKLYHEWENSKFAGPRFCVDGLVNSHHIPEYSNRISEIAIIELKSNPDMSRATHNITLDQQRKHYKEETLAGQQQSYRTVTISYVATFYLTSLFLVLVLFKSILLLNTNNVRGLTIITYAASILLANFFSGLSNTMNFVLDLQQRRGYWCTILAMLTHYFILASASWLVLVAWELRQALRCNNPGAHQTGSRFRYKCYFCGVFGSLVIVVGWLLYRDVNYGAFAWFFSPCPVLVPGYGVDWCFLSYQSQRKLLYLPLFMLHLIGLALYLVTIRQLRNTQASHFWIEEYIEIHSRSDPSLALVLKLLLVELLSCIIDSLSSYWKPNVETPEDASFWVVFLSIVVNISRAIILFTVLVDGNPETFYEEPRRVRWLATALTSSPTRISASDDVSENAYAELELQMALPRRSTSGIVVVEGLPSVNDSPPHPSDPGDPHLETEV